jgi:hypothetical protein
MFIGFVILKVDFMYTRKIGLFDPSIHCIIPQSYSAETLRNLPATFGRRSAVVLLAGASPGAERLGI